MSLGITHQFKCTAVLMFLLVFASCSTENPTNPRIDDSPDANIVKARNDVGSDGVTPGSSTVPEAANEPKPLTLAFNDTEYVHRYSTNGLHEFTPDGQNDLQQWSDMLSINVYADAHDGEALSQIANKVLSVYKSHKGMVLRTDSVPRTQDSSAEHLIVVMFGRPEFIEAVQSRFLLRDNVSMAVIHSHRIYGRMAGDEMSAWLEKNGPGLEQALTVWGGIPTPKSLQSLNR